MRRPISLAALLASTFLATAARAADEPAFERKADVIYGRKHGVALTMDVFTPKKEANGAAVVLIVSGGYFSSKEAINPAFFRPLLGRGYTVFAVVHGSQPQYTVPEIVADVNRAIRFIRFHAAEYGVSPDRIGATGASAGGHLSLMLGTAGTPGAVLSLDPVERTSSRVQAVACFFPPTDFLNFGAPGREMIDAKEFGQPFRPAFEHREIDKKTNLWVNVTDPEKLRAIAKSISPVAHVTPDDAPTLILHGADDDLVPVQQSETIVAKLKEAGVDAKLVVKPGAGHGWLGMIGDMDALADWFDAHLKAKP